MNWFKNLYRRWSFDRPSFKSWDAQRRHKEIQ